MDFSLVLSKCEYLDLNLILTGKSFNNEADPVAETIPDKTEINQNAAVKVFRLQTDYLNLDVQTIPLYHVQATAGLIPLFKDSFQQPPYDHIVIPNAPKCDGAIYAVGDSMYPIAKAGDIVCYKKTIPEYIIWGEMYLIDLSVADDEILTIK